MENCDYEAVNTYDSDSYDNSSIEWKYFFRQILISSSLWTLYFNAGLCVGTPTVLVPQMKKGNTTILDAEMESWLYSAFGLGAIPWVLIVPTFSNYFGRKLPYLLSCVSMLAAFLILYFSVEPYQILISEVVQGLAHASNVTITVVMVTEYTDAKYRGIFLTIKSASFFWGIWAANAIGTFFHWKYIAVAGIICSLYTFIAALYPESPQWLASKGKYERSKSAFRWLHGTHKTSEKELQNIIVSQSNQRKRNQKTKSMNGWKSFSDTVTSQLFYKPLGLAILMSLQYHFSGKLVCSTYAVEVIKKITGDETATYSGMLILDGVTVIGMYVGSFASKILKRRTLYMTSSFIGVAFLFISALYLYLSKLRIIEDNNIVSIFLLTIYSVSISCGPMIMSSAITGEIIPRRYQAICYQIYAALLGILFTLSLKFANVIFVNLEMHGTFLFYGITAGLYTVVLYCYLPETKDKTLLEIEEYFKDDKDRVKIDEESMDGKG